MFRRLDFALAVIVVALAGCLLLAGSATTSPAQAGASIYDAQILRHLKLQSGQRSKVRKVVRRSDAEMARVFKKYKINPMTKPDFDKLVAASSELQAIERRERKEMKKILTANQLKQYDQLINITRIRVRKAAN